ncbi:hypothetical protein LX32DRAFT_646428 [Colletotrichum zoysiae]|uniref:Transmembrane protein n=1 Tax=Colletotrichum zoysiae TaxID=1216348 RepID=A0AAD9LU95_9PEZI|nr:hypothetical protein LX32DRAFT_646428 [Colletotrichum zoysiae]
MPCEARPMLYEYAPLPVPPQRSLFLLRERGWVGGWQITAAVDLTGLTTRKTRVMQRRRHRLSLVSEFRWRVVWLSVGATMVCVCVCVRVWTRRQVFLGY